MFFAGYGTRTGKHVTLAFTCHAGGAKKNYCGNSGRWSAAAGLNDLKLAVGATKILNIPCGLVINRSDLGDDTVREYANSENLPVLLDIPFDRRIAEAYSRGDMIVDVMPEWKEKFLALYESIQNRISALKT